MSERSLPTWAVAPGLPTAHTLRAALRVAATIDPGGSRVADTRESYWHAATGGILPPGDLSRGEDLLLDLGFAYRVGDVLHLAPALVALLDGTVEEACRVLVLAAADLAVSQDPTRVAEISSAAEALCPDDEGNETATAAFGRFDDRLRRLVGEIGEEIVVAVARRELLLLGREDLARETRRVSLESDHYGYDIVAARLSGMPRLLEVKSTTAQIAPTEPRVEIFLSRNEAEVGLRERDWSLVLCHVDDIENRDGKIVGWLFARELTDLLPNDAESGRWESARLSIPVGRFREGLPGAV